MPLSFQRSDNGTRNSEFDGLMSPEAFDNIYMRMVESISPGEMVGQFMNSASPRVQAAVKSTIMGLLGRCSPRSQLKLLRVDAPWIATIRSFQARNSFVSGCH